jgi:hypothetical protein
MESIIPLNAEEIDDAGSSPVGLAGISLYRLPCALWCDVVVAVGRRLHHLVEIRVPLFIIRSTA